MDDIYASDVEHVVMLKPSHEHEHHATDVEQLELDTFRTTKLQLEKKINTLLAMSLNYCTFL